MPFHSITAGKQFAHPTTWNNREMISEARSYIFRCQAYDLPPITSLDNLSLCCRLQERAWSLNQLQVTIAATIEVAEVSFSLTKRPIGLKNNHSETRVFFQKTMMSIHFQMKHFRGTNFLNQSFRSANGATHHSVIYVHWETSSRDSKDRCAVKELKKKKKYQGRGRIHEINKYKAKYLNPESHTHKKHYLRG